MDVATKPAALDLEVEALESACRPGCSTSTTHLLCTCPCPADALIAGKLTSAPKS